MKHPTITISGVRYSAYTTTGRAAAISARRAAWSRIKAAVTLWSITLAVFTISIPVAATA